MKAAELTTIIPKIRITDTDTKRVYEGYYCEIPETTYCCLPHPPIKTVRMIVTHTMTDWGLPNQIHAYQIHDDDEVEIIEAEPSENTKWTEWDVTCDPEYRESHFEKDEWGES